MGKSRSKRPYYRARHKNLGDLKEEDTKHNFDERFKGGSSRRHASEPVYFGVLSGSEESFQTLTQDNYRSVVNELSPLGISTSRARGPSSSSHNNGGRASKRRHNSTPTPASTPCYNFEAPRAAVRTSTYPPFIPPASYAYAQGRQASSYPLSFQRISVPPTYPVQEELSQIPSTQQMVFDNTSMICSNAYQLPQFFISEHDSSLDNTPYSGGPIIQEPYDLTMSQGLFQVPPTSFTEGICSGGVPDYITWGLLVNGMEQDVSPSSESMSISLTESPVSQALLDLPAASGEIAPHPLHPSYPNWPETSGPYGY